MSSARRRRGSPRRASGSPRLRAGGRRRASARTIQNLAKRLRAGRETRACEGSRALGGARGSPRTRDSMITFSNVSKQYGGQILLRRRVVLRGATAKRVGLVGPNGSGKSSIFRLIMEEEHPDDGIVDRPKRMTVGYFRQDVGDLKGRSVLAETLAGAGEAGRLGEELKVLELKLNDHEAPDFADAVDRYSEVPDALPGARRLRPRGTCARDPRRVLGFSPDMIENDVGALSGGWKMRVALAQILLAQPDALLLDEPTNYLDIESIIWLEDFLRGYRGAVLMTCHDQGRPQSRREEDRRDRRRRREELLRRLRFLRGPARDRREAGPRRSTNASRRCSRRSRRSSIASRRAQATPRRCRAA